MSKKVFKEIVNFVAYLIMAILVFVIETFDNLVIGIKNVYMIEWMLFKSMSSNLPLEKRYEAFIYGLKKYYNFKRCSKEEG